MPYPVQNLIEDHGKPVCVQPDQLVRRALSLMIEHDYSQLPVLDGENRPKGMVTYGSIVRALSNFKLTVDQLEVADAIVKAPEYHPEDDLFDLLDRLKDTNAVLIVDGADRLVGIVTTYDSTEYFRRRAEDMMLVEDIENMVKDLILVPFTDEHDQIDEAALQQSIAKITGSHTDLEKRLKRALSDYLGHHSPDDRRLRPEWVQESLQHLIPSNEPKGFDDLTLHDYIQLLLSEDRWHYYEDQFSLGRTAIRSLLNDVRSTRNDLAHFRQELSSDQRDQLRFCVSWLASYPVEAFFESSMGIPVDWATPDRDVPAVAAHARDERATYGTDNEIQLYEDNPGPSESRYAPLALRLQGQPGSRDRLTLEFGEIESIIGGDLPRSAREHRNWWANAVAHVQSQQWLEAGWRVGQINMTEERVSFVRIREREQAYIQFFSQLQERLRGTTDLPLRELSPDGTSWQTLVGLPQGGPQVMPLVASFARGHRLRVELYIDTGSQDRNKAIFDAIRDQGDEIVRDLEEDVSWERLDSRRASRIAVYHPGAIDDDQATLDSLLDWVARTAPQFYGVLKPYAEDAYRVTAGDLD